MSKRLTHVELETRISELDRENLTLKESAREIEERYHTLFERLFDLVYLHDFDGNILDTNDIVFDTLGYTRTEVKNLTLADLLSEDQMPVVEEVMQELFESGTQKKPRQFRAQHKDGSFVWLETMASVIYRAGVPYAIQGIARNITERKQTEDAMRASEEKYRSILESMQEAYFEVDLQGNFTFFNEAGVRMLGYEPAELHGMNYRQYTSPETARRMAMVFKRIFKTGTPALMVDYQVIHKDGTPRDHELSAWLMRDAAGTPIGYQALARDVTARKRAELALRGSEERYRAIFENTGSASVLLDADTTVLLANSNFEKLSGYAKDEIESKMSWTAFVYPPDLEQMRRFHDQRREVPGSVPESYEFRLKNRSGELRDIFLTVVLIPGSGESVATCMDITDRKRAEKALRESEERWQFALEGAGDGVWDLNLEENTVYRSRRWKAMLGYAEDEIGHTPDEWMHLIHPDDLPRSNDSLQRHLRGEIADYQSEYRIKAKDGSYRWVLDRGKVIQWSNDGRPLRIIGTQSDIMTRKQAEETIRRSEERYRTIFENTATANIITAEDTTILLANSNFEKLTGFSRSEVEGRMSWTDFVVKEDLEMLKRYHTLRRVDPGAPPRSYEFRARNRAGEVLYLFMNVAMIPGTRDSVASMIDITERKRAEDNLRQSEERFRDLAQLLPESVFEIDQTGRFVFVNQVSLERFGYTQDDIDQGVSYLDILAPEDHDRGRASYQRIMSGEQLGLNEYTAQRKDGTTFPALIHTTRIIRDGSPVGFRGFLVDITEKKTIEQQLLWAQKMEAIGTLAGGIAHDFNNLLMGILGNISLMLLQCEETHSFYERLKNMEQYVKRGSDLTKQLLGFARGGRYEVKPTDLGEFVARSAEMFARTKKEIRIHFKAVENSRPVEVDRGQMEQVLLNLFLNAWQSMPGGGDLYLAVANVDLAEEEAALHKKKPGHFVKIMVTDTGIGMDEATKARIFEPFFTTRERGRGTGLGLASVYGIVKNHGGFILVESEPDIGTTFTLFFPASTKPVEREVRGPSPMLAGRETVLLIDDEEMILDVGKRMLEGLGYKVLVAPGGRQGLYVYECNKDTIDLVILDMIMPDCGGWETFGALRRQNASVKVLLSSGYSLDESAKEMLAAGCKGFIQKPFNMAEISMKLREILDE